MSKLTGDWKKAEKALAVLAKNTEKAARQALLQDAHFMRGKVVEGIDSQAPGGKPFKPLSMATLARRRAQGFSGTKALIRTAAMRNSVAVMEKDGVIFVGVSRTVKGRGGEDLINLAMIHEYGAGPWVQRRGNRLVVLQIPARPFLGPVFDKYAEPGALRQRLEQRAAAILEKLMRG